MQRFCPSAARPRRTPAEVRGDHDAVVLLGGIIGAFLAWLVVDGVRTATLNWQTFSQVAFAFDVDAALLIRGIVSAVVIGVVGGLFPAIRAARLPVAVALRER